MEHDFIFAADEFHHKTEFANEMRQTDLSYFKSRVGAGIISLL